MHSARPVPGPAREPGAAERVVALVGPTAVGKSSVAVELAQLLGAEIVSCDSMQVYRRMRVLSQAPTHAQRAQVPHHAIECVEPTEPFSVGAYCRLAAPAIERLLACGKRVLIVGGTGLYVKALAEGLCEAPPADAGVRERLWNECRGLGSPTLHHRLQRVDAAAASRIHPHDVRRVIRALEVYAVTGRPLSSWWQETSRVLRCRPITVIGLTRERAALYQRINTRLLHMIYEEAVINEVRSVLPLPLSQTARQVHGLADIERYLEGQLTLKELVAVWQQRVRNYARRQLTWFRQTPGIRWVSISDEERPWETAGRIREGLPRIASATVASAPAASPRTDSEV